MDRRYHHGKLREALIAEGVKLIEESGVKAMTLREIGSRAGVSRTAAYRHFSNREELLQAICEAGFTEFGDTLEASRSSVRDSVAAQLAAMGQAYVRFAMEHRAYYQVMFGMGRDTGRIPRESAAAARAFEILAETIREGQDCGELRAADTTQLAKFVWAVTHGIATLEFGADFMAQSMELLRTGIGAS